MANAVVQAVLQSSPGTGVGSAAVTYEMWKAFDNELVASTAAVESVVNTAGPMYGFLLTPYKYFGAWLNAQSASGTADVKLEILQSYDDATTTTYVSPNTAGTITSSHGETAKVYAVTPVPMPRLRFRVTGVNANPADTRVTLYYWAQA